MEAGGGIEPPIEDLQSPALPLCYPATHDDYHIKRCRKIKRKCEIRRAYFFLDFGA